MQNAPPAAEPVPCNCLALRQAARQASQLYDRHMAAVGLRTTQYSILNKLARLGPQSIQDLAGQMVMERTAMGRALQPLERDGLVASEVGRDARSRLVRLTPAGKARLKAAAVHWKAAQAEFERVFGQPESAALRTTLARLVAAL
jgi:DNA-binding MarR family transcriptional regulator